MQGTEEGQCGGPRRIAGMRPYQTRVAQTIDKPRAVSEGSQALRL